MIARIFECRKTKSAKAKHSVFRPPVKCIQKPLLEVVNRSDGTCASNLFKPIVRKLFVKTASRLSPNNPVPRKSRQE